MAKKKAGHATPATAVLTQLGIDFAIREYEHVPGVTEYGDEAAQALGENARRVFKTLLAQVGDRLVVGVVPVAGRLDLKALATAVNARKAEMADPKLAERKTGYVVGGISPIGQRTKLATVIDRTALEYATVLVSGGRRGLDIELTPHDLARATEANFANIGRG